MAEMIRTRMTAQDYFQLPETMLPMELLDGEVIMAPAPDLGHQYALGDLHIMLRQIVPNGRVLLAPVDVYLDDDNVVQPDILWIAEGSRCKPSGKHLAGAPDLIIEIVSPGSRRRDKVEKYRLYEKHGVREYWTFYAKEAYVEVFVHDGSAFRLQGIYTAEDTFASPVLGRDVTLKAVFEGLQASDE